SIPGFFSASAATRRLLLPRARRRSPAAPRLLQVNRKRAGAHSTGGSLRRQPHAGGRRPGRPGQGAGQPEAHRGVGLRQVVELVRAVVLLGVLPLQEAGCVSTPSPSSALRAPRGRPLGPRSYRQWVAVVRGLWHPPDAPSYRAALPAGAGTGGSG